MNLLSLHEGNFNQVVTANPFIIMNFQADWCQPCMHFAQIFEAVAAKHADIRFATIDADAGRGLADSFGVTVVPSLIIMRNKTIVARATGAHSAAGLEKLIERARTLDLAGLHRGTPARTGDANTTDR